MTKNSKYVLDANVFIEAKNRYYAFDLAPKFWENLKHFSKSGNILCIDRIKKQLQDGNDNLAKWIADGNLNEAFQDSGQDDVVAAYKEIMNWVQANPQFNDAAKLLFANDPDGWLIAYAKAKGCFLVTHETLKVDAKSKVPIPNVCKAFGVQTKNTFEMLRELGIKFEK